MTCETLKSCSFKGLSSPKELKTTWFNLTEGQGIQDITVIWDFQPSILNNIKEGLYVINLLYPYIGDKTGHYVAYYKKDKLRGSAEKIYFDPLGSLPPEDIVPYVNVVDLEGAQAINGNSCGYRCLTKLFKYALGYKPKYKIDIDNGKFKGDIKPETLFKSKREFKILNSLK